MSTSKVWIITNKSVVLKNRTCDQNNLLKLSYIKKLKIKKHLGHLSLSLFVWCSPSKINLFDPAVMPRKFLSCQRQFL